MSQQGLRFTLEVDGLLAMSTAVVSFTLHQNLSTPFIRGKEAEVIWTLSITRAQYDAGLREEVRRTTMPLPERKHGQDFLHVHFLPGDKVFLGWSEGAGSPYEKRNEFSYQSEKMQEAQP